jgi:hypothetical protein
MPPPKTIRHEPPLASANSSPTTSSSTIHIAILIAALAFRVQIFIAVGSISGALVALWFVE